MFDVNRMQLLFNQEYGSEGGEVYCFFAPGRVNLIGEHTDYNGGYVFPAAISLGIYATLRFRRDNLVRLKSMNAAPFVTVDPNKPVLYSEDDGWGNYPKGIIKYLLESGHRLQGCDVLFSADLPEGAGLSSSAAIMVLTAFALRYANGDTVIDRSELAKFCQKVENEFIKVNCGIMDQFSVAMGRQDYAILLDCATLEYRYVPFVLKQHSLVIMNTNKKRELAESRYNERRSECEQALAIIRRRRPLKNLCQASLTEVEMLHEDDVLWRRSRHIVTENNRVLTAVELLEQGDIAGFGALMTASHVSLKNNYEVSGTELDAIVDCALRTPGCIGARMTGAGFGGCAIALVENTTLTEFKAAVMAGYRERTGRMPAFYVAGIADGVKSLNVEVVDERLYSHG